MPSKPIKYSFLISHFCSDTASIRNKIVYLIPKDIPTDLQLDGTYEMSNKNDIAFTPIIEDFFKKHFSYETVGVGNYIRISLLSDLG